MGMLPDIFSKRIELDDEGGHGDVGISPEEAREQAIESIRDAVRGVSDPGKFIKALGAAAPHVGWNLDSAIGVARKAIEQMGGESPEDSEEQGEPDDAEVDALLDEILGGLDDDGGEREQFIRRDIAEQYAAQRAPKGGVEINGTFYAGGRFIPGEQIAKASESERQTLKAKKKVESPSKAKPEVVKGVARITRGKPGAGASKLAQHLGVAGGVDAKEILRKIVEHARAAGLHEDVTEVPKVAETPAKAKEPWEMRQSEWTDGHIKSPGMHREHIRLALAAGKAVPSEVLAEYPDLAPPTSEQQLPATAPKGRGRPVHQPASEAQVKSFASKFQALAQDVKAGEAGYLDVIAQVGQLEDSGGPAVMAVAKAMGLQAGNADEALKALHRHLMGGPGRYHQKAP